MAIEAFGVRTAIEPVGEQEKKGDREYENTTAIHVVVCSRPGNQLFCGTGELVVSGGPREVNGRT